VYLSVSSAVDVVDRCSVCFRMLCAHFRVMVLQNGEIIEFESPTSLLANSSSQFYSMARDAGLVWETGLHWAGRPSDIIVMGCTQHQHNVIVSSLTLLNQYTSFHWPFDVHCCHMDTATKHAQSWASECLDVNNYKWRLNPVWHRMLCSCTHMATVGVKGLSD